MLRTPPALRLLAIAAALLLLFALPGGAGAGAEGYVEAKRALEAAISARDEAAAREAIKAVAADDSNRAVKTLAAASAAALDLDIYKDLVAAIGGMKSEEAVKEAARLALGDRAWTVRFLLVEALARIDHPEARRGLFAAFEDRHESVAVNAMSACREAKLKSAVRPLIEALEKLEKRQKGSKVHAEAARALAGITGEQFSAAGDWRRWWEQNEKSFDPKAAEEARAGREDRATVLRRVHDRGEYEFVERLDRGDILVVEGQSDKTADVLDALKLPYTRIERPKAPEAFQRLDPRSVLVIDCNGDLSKAFKGIDAKAIAAFVERGGYLFTSDWGIGEVIGPALPGYMGPGPKMPQEAFDVKIAPARGQEKHPYLRDVFPENPYKRAQMKWKIDNLAFGIEMTPKATALIESSELSSRYGAPVVAATFRHGKGAVLHVMGHFKMQRDEAGDGFALQQLLVNFIVEKQKFRKKSK